MNKIYKIGSLVLISLVLLTSCKKFVFFEVQVDEDNNPITKKKMPKTSADLYEPPIVTTDIPNPDPDGAFNDWATCLLLIKEGHSHGSGKLHGNPVLSRGMWRQEQLAMIHNTANGIEVKVDSTSTVTFFEKTRGIHGPEELRIVGGNKLWAFCLRFFDKEGKMINNEILKQSDQYQIFFTISDLDDKGQPYDVMDLRYEEDEDGNVITPVPSEFFKKRASYEARREATHKVFHYTYRDTWQEEDMSDGVRNLFNIRLLPPLEKTDYDKASNIYDQDNVGLKGHIRFYYNDGYVDPKTWPLKLSQGYGFTRTTNLLPKFYLAIRVLKCPKGKKAVIDPKAYNEGVDPDERISPISKRICAPFDKPDERSEWTEVIRMNIPIRMYCNTDDSNPTNIDAYEPYYFQISREIGLSPEEGFEAIKNVDPYDTVGWVPDFFL